MRSVLVPWAAAAAVLVVAAAGPASAVDVDRRLAGRHEPSVERPLLLAELKPEARCHLVRVVPVGGAMRDLLYRPCEPAVELPPYTPFEERPPIPIPVEPRR
jgi:hypothetical protein